MSKEHSSGTSISAGAISLLERATHFPTVLLILSFLLALDSGLSLGYRSTLLTLSWEFVQQHISIGAILIFFLFFGLYMSIGVGFVRYFADQLAHIAVYPLWIRLFPHDDRGLPPYCGAVRPYKLREAAHSEQNKFFLDLYNEHVARQAEKRGQEWSIASTAFACLLLGGINYLVLPLFGHLSFSSQLASSYPDIWKWALLIFSVLLSAIWLYPIIKDDSATEWVYCLSLYEKLRKEKIKEREQLLCPSIHH